MTSARRTAEALAGAGVRGSLDGMVNGLVKGEAHGRYLEGTGCVKPVGATDRRPRAVLAPESGEFGE
ncbi:hypothetical protein ACIODT_05695 [Streptomyces sp. NPDC088251]|uniref:hypothetical protein n=1 Tax=unclassified Streptomyces TaxID=2593676 RepID=UPI0037FFEEE5